jgi:hypothetical protein
MKIIVFFLAMLAFNLGAQFFLHSGIFPETPTAAETGFINTTGDINTTFGPNLDDTQQWTLAANIVGIIMRGITFDWMFWYLPPEIQETDNIEALRIGLGALALIINGGAIIELFMRRGDVFK